MVDPTIRLPPPRPSREEVEARKWLKKGVATPTTRLEMLTKTSFGILLSIPYTAKGFAYLGWAAAKGTGNALRYCVWKPPVYHFKATLLQSRDYFEKAIRALFIGIAAFFQALYDPDASKTFYLKYGPGVVDKRNSTEKPKLSPGLVEELKQKIVEREEQRRADEAKKTDETNNADKTKKPEVEEKDKNLKTHKPQISKPPQTTQEHPLKNKTSSWHHFSWLWPSDQTPSSDPSKKKIVP